ncbi:hypothetical protein UF75_2038 [Desulfosporosinus sp. I2]|uniref:LCP family protein n=1 Tax=Desulfosporosinus sp. I2 TaxID=1617025 RepID=UPI00061EF637|nr:LCP family protein [Desulfosporosinus sp. I2]KJR47612.1 hypothetical protein UF75_2038 [Desulfosporosinus sp. I2]
MFDAKEKTLEMEWTRMNGKKRWKLAISRVFKAYKKSLFIGFFIGVSLVMGVLIVGQVIGKENKSITSVTEGVDQKLRNVEVPIQTNFENNEPIDEIEKSPDQSPEELFEKPSEGSSKSSLAPFDKNHFTVLVVGLDRRIGEKSIGNTDTLLMASINTIIGQVTLLSIPRDTQVTILGYGREKINAAARLGKGLKTTEVLVEGLTGQKIDGYVLTNFSGFKTIIDILGGINLMVEKDMYYVTGDEKDGIINLHKGTQRLNGTQALQYARFRQDALGDISRTTRQQAVIKAMVKEFLQLKTVPKIPSLIKQMNKSVETDLSVGQLWSLANLLLSFEKLDLISQTLPGNFLIENDVSYWKVNPQKSKVVVRRLLEEGKTTSVFFNNGAKGEVLESTP